MFVGAVRTGSPGRIIAIRSSTGFFHDITINNLQKNFLLPLQIHLEPSLKDLFSQRLWIWAASGLSLQSFC
jgi:hypothetical protein